MTFAMWVMIILMTVYSAAFSISLWKNKNKGGSLFIMLLALFILIAPYFILFK
jgi:hypothetical protein